VTHRDLAQRLKQATRILTTGRASKYSDDEIVGFLLNDVRPVIDAQSDSPRLTILTPTLSAKAAFGGVATLVELPLQVFRHRLADLGWRVRFVCFDAAPATDDNIALHYADRLEIPRHLVSVEAAFDHNGTIAVAKNDLFLGSLWPNFYDAEKLIDFQLATFGGDRSPYISMIQDYEPAFYPWSSAYLLALGTYESDLPKRLIFNSRELEAFYTAQGHPGNERCVFEPVMNARLKDRLPDDLAARKEKQILVYGRPEDRRNCFYLVKQAVERWSRFYPDAHEWRVVSVGAVHDPFDLQRGVNAEVKGKLTLDGYAEHLTLSAVGLSLMASPHPSYPPLEMAHYGALTITNAFPHKDLTQWHSNIVSLPVATPESLCAALCKACDAFAADQSIGAKGRSGKPGYTQSHADPVLDEIAAMILGSATEPTSPLH
jgi:O-antigen biosynthesis protein